MIRWKQVGRRGFLFLLATALLCSCVPLKLIAVRSEGITIASSMVAGRENPLGIDREKVRFSWKMVSVERNQMQSAYQILVSSSEGKSAESEGDVWDSGWVESGEQYGIFYEGEELKEKTRYWWKVRVKNQDGLESDWSKIQWFETGINDWNAKWLGGNNIKLLANQFTVDPDKDVAQARVYITSQSYHELHINGNKIGEHILTPPYAQHYARAYYLTYDITKEIQSGENAIGIMLGGGQKAKWYDSVRIAKLRLEVRYTDGSETVLTTNPEDGWLMSESSPVTRDDFFYGEDYDATFLIGWDKPGYVERVKQEGRQFRDWQYWKAAEVYSGAVQVEDGKLYLNGAGLQAVGEFEDFVYESEATINQSVHENCFGMIFRKEDDQNFYMWQVNLNPGMGGMMLRPHVFYQGAWVDVRGIDLSKISGVDVRIGKPFEFKLVVSGQRIQTYIDGILVDDWTSERTIGKGELGYRVAADENLTLDDVVVSQNGSVLLEDSFDQADPEKWLYPDLFSPTISACNTFTHIDREYDAQVVNRISDQKAVLDFSQNLAGYVRVKAKGNKNDTVKITYAELLKEDNTIEGHTLTGLKNQLVTCTYTLNGDKDGEVFEPKFFYTGFRYVEIETTGAVSIDQVALDIKSCLVTEDMEQTGFFESSDVTLNRVFDLYRFAQMSNTIGLFLASPHREKDGWLGDSLVTSEAVNYLYDATRLYEKFFYDMDDTQYYNDSRYPDGMIRVFVPHNPKGEHDIADIPWQSGRVLMPWYVYQKTGDKSVLSEHYTNMKMTVNFFTKLNAGEYPYIASNNSFSDWLGIDNRNGKVSPAYCSDIFYYASIDTLQKMAEVLEESNDAETYRTLAEQVKQEINQKWLVDGSYYDQNTMTSNSLALAYGVVPEENKAAVTESMKKNVLEKDYGAYAGVLGMESIFRALAMSGSNDLAFRMASKTEYPSLGYMAEQGATTLWEFFEEYGSPDAVFGPELQSQNHNMFGGGFTAWLFRDLAGISSLEEGYDRFRIRPASGVPVEWVKTHLDSIHGIITSDWKKDGQMLDLLVTVPVNTTAMVYVPVEGYSDFVVKEDGKIVAQEGKKVGKSDLNFVGAEGQYYVFEVGSGEYHFSVTSAKDASAHDWLIPVALTTAIVAVAGAAVWAVLYVRKQKKG